MSELVALDTNILDGVHGPGETYNISVLRKGRKEGSILAPQSLINESSIYVTTYRKAWLAQAREKYGPNECRTEALFVGKLGLPVKKKTYQLAVKSAAARCGIRATTHVLRATFACIMLARLEQLAANGAPINPLLIVKVLMGHEHIATTDRYLRAVATDRDSIEDALDILTEGL